MFVRLPGGLPPDPVFPDSLKEHGFFINTQNQIRNVENPEDGVRFRISRNDRYNSMRMRSIHAIVMNEISKRLENIGVQKLYVPQLTTVKPETQCLPIFVTEPDKLKHKDRVIVVIPQSQNELEVFNFAGMFGDDGIEEASPISMAKELRDEGDTAPGLVIANTSQLLYSHIEKKALSLFAWYNRARKSMIHRQHVILEEYNIIPGHETPEKHIQWVFESFLKNTDFISPKAKIDIIAVRESGTAVIQYLNSNFEKFASQISSMAIIHSFYDVSMVKNKTFRHFLANRARSWIWSSEPVNKPIADTLAAVNYGTLCPTFSGGEENAPELIIMRSRKAILEWLKYAYNNPAYVNPEYTVVNVSEDGTEMMMKLEITEYIPDEPVLDDTPPNNKETFKEETGQDDPDEPENFCKDCGKVHDTVENLSELGDWETLSYPPSDEERIIRP